MRLLHPAVRDLAPGDLLDLYDLPGPHLRAGFVASVDGVVAVDGRSAGLGSPADKAVFRTLRAVSDAVVVGAGTARDEDYGPVRYDEAARTWRAARGRNQQPPVVIVSRRGRLAPDAKVLQGPVILAVPEGVETPVGIDVIRTTDPLLLKRSLHQRGLTRLLCEGGPSLLTAMLRAGAVDELCLTTAPTTVGDGPRLLTDAAGADLVLASLVLDDPGVLLARWSVVRSPA
ncbi:MAG: bifunctional deaminase-reductase domain protein [Frankiales bacterium]|nr:bifunctional deaminase-reductase domain protein [Frankiales bacterium]